MWSQTLPDCATCDVRKANWQDRQCEMCKAEAQLLEEMFDE